MGDLWSLLRKYIEDGRETNKIDLKRTLDFNKKKTQSDLAKDISAIANTPNGNGYIIIGVVDKKDRINEDPNDYIVGFDIYKFEQIITQSLINNCNPIPEIEIFNINHPEINKKIGVIKISRSLKRPHAFAGKFFIRRNSHNTLVDSNEIHNPEAKVVINFGRNIESHQIEQIQNLTSRDIAEVIDVNAQIDDDLPIYPQIDAIINSVDLTKDEWMNLPLIVNTHPLSPIGSALMAAIHGIRGNFPDIVFMTRNEAGQFDVKEILCLQKIRNEKRSLTVIPD